jgi:hypothetical protein
MYIAVISFIQNFIQHPSLKVKSICRRIVEDHQCGSQPNRSTTDEIFCIRHITGGGLERNETVHQLVIDFKEACNSARREILYSVLIEFGVAIKLNRLI